MILKDLGMQYFREGDNRRFHKWLVKCSDCGKEFETFCKHTERCRACGDKEAGRKRTKHGMHKHRLYTIWRSCKSRCYNPNHRQYKNYGGAGVTICAEWLNSFENFAKWALANGYKDNYQLDKDQLCEELGISPKIYSPDTCKWIPQSENANRLRDEDHQRTGSCKLSFNDVKEILKKRAEGLTHKQIAAQYNVDDTTICWNCKRFRLENNELRRI